MSDDLTIIHDSADMLEVETVAVARHDAGRAPVPGPAQSAALSPMELIRFAIESKTPASELSQLVTLATQVENRNAAREFNRALAAFQRECPPIKKNRTANIKTRGGGEFSYAYAERDVMAAHVKPYLEKHGFSLMFDTTMDEKGILLTNTCTLLHENGHSRSSKFTLPIMNESAASPQQKVGAADSYAARRTMGAVLGLDITDKEAPDSEADTKPITAEQAHELLGLINAKKRGRNDESVFLQRFLDKYRVETIEQLPAKKFENAVAMLRAIRAKDAVQ